MASSLAASSKAARDRAAKLAEIQRDIEARRAAGTWRNTEKENAKEPEQRVHDIPKGFEWTTEQAAALPLLTGSARHTMLYGGSRSGKTFLLCSFIALRALKDPKSRHAIFRHRFNHLKTSIGFDTFPKVMATRFPGIKYRLDKTDWFFEIEGGSRIYLAGLDDKERTEKILGQEYATLYFNECSQIAYSSVLMARTRLAQKTKLINRAYYDCNPPGSKHWTALVFVGKKDPVSRPAGQPIKNPDNYCAGLLNPDSNKHNLSPEYLAELEALPERQRQRFLLGKFTAELDNALWNIDSFRRCEVYDPEKGFISSLAPIERIVVAVDPSGASGEEDKRSDEIGIVAAAKHTDGQYSVLADYTLRASPQKWAQAVVQLYRDLGADRIVAEANFGGAMVEATIRNEDPTAPVKIVKASRTKQARAEPIAALYEKNLVHHAGEFSELEDQLVNMTTAGYMGERSPDRADTLVWALFELSGGRTVEPSFEVF